MLFNISTVGIWLEITDAMLQQIRELTSAEEIPGLREVKVPEIGRHNTLWAPVGQGVSHSLVMGVVYWRSGLHPRPWRYKIDSLRCPSG